MFTQVQALVLALVLHAVNPCYLHGTDSGECSDRTLDPAWKIGNMPFCQDAIQYPACLPKVQRLPPSKRHQNQYPNRDYAPWWPFLSPEPPGRWTLHTVLTKDDWIKNRTETHVAYRKEIETNEAYLNENTNEYDDPDHPVTTRFNENEDCVEAYKNFFCWINFPRCDMDRYVYCRVLDLDSVGCLYVLPPLSFHS